MNMQLNIKTLQSFLDSSFKEDYGIKGDITSDAVIRGEDYPDVYFQINSREDIIVCGTEIAEYYFQAYSAISYKVHLQDGSRATKGKTIISGRGQPKEILLLERVILNFLQHLSGIATATDLYVQKVSNTKAKICDTRKTLPSYRSMQKYAVWCGGGQNHRLSLDSSILIKDNHIAICGSVAKALEKAKEHNPHYAKIEIECDTLLQVKEALQGGADIIMLDNMSIEQIIEAKKLIGNKAIIEVSGGVNLKNVEEIAKTGVDLISIGRLTHSVSAVDIGLDIENE